MTPEETAEMRSQIQALRALRTQGVRTARFGEDEVTFRSDAEIASAIADLERRLGAAEGKPSVTFVNFRSNRGWS